MIPDVGDGDDRVRATLAHLLHDVFPNDGRQETVAEDRYLPALCNDYGLAEGVYPR